MRKFTKIMLIICGICAAAGITLVASGLAMGFSTGELAQIIEGEGVSVIRRGSFTGNSRNMIDVYETFDKSEVKNLEMLIDAGTVNIEMSDGDQIIIEGKASEYFTASIMSGGTLCIEDNNKSGNIFKRIDTWSGQLNVTIPEDSSFENTRQTIGAGEFYASGIKTKELKVEVGAGTFTGRGFHVADKSKLEAGAGTVELSGDLTGQIEAECGVGKIAMNMDGDYEQYNYKIECGIGSVSVGGSSYSGLGREQKINNNAANNMKLQCGIGEIEVDF